MVIRSRKFQLLVLDVFVSLTLFFVSKYYPVALEDVKFVIGALQPVFISVIVGIAVEDGAEKFGSKNTWQSFDDVELDERLPKG